ncbi:MAG: hypothetical protein K2G70_06885, partial [Turicibacter sp.]|nr:hypothetical protein [Turicibacter sp.]
DEETVSNEVIITAIPDRPVEDETPTIPSEPDQSVEDETPTTPSELDQPVEDEMPTIPSELDQSNEEEQPTIPSTSLEPLGSTNPTPDTGDETNLTLWLSLIGVSVVGIGTTVVIFNKKKKNYIR